MNHTVRLSKGGHLEDTLRWVRFGGYFLLGFFPAFLISFMFGDKSGNCGRMARLSIVVFGASFLIAMVCGPEIRRRPWLAALAVAFLGLIGILHHWLPFWFQIPITW